MERERKREGAREKDENTRQLGYKGSQFWLTFPSARAEMTLLRERRDLLIVLASSRVSPWALVLSTCTRRHSTLLQSPNITKVVAALCEGHDSGSLKMQKCDVHTFTSNASTQHFNDTTLTKKGKKTEDKRVSQTV